VSGHETTPKPKRVRSKQSILKDTTQENQSAEKLKDTVSKRRQTAGSELTDTLNKLQKKSTLPGRYDASLLPESPILTGEPKHDLETLKSIYSKLKTVQGEKDTTFDAYKVTTERQISGSRL
jgi:hypothetical protein